MEGESWAVWNPVTDHVQPRGSHFSFINPLTHRNSIGDVSACIKIISKWFSLHKLHQPRRRSHLHSNGKDLRKQLNSKFPSSICRDSPNPQQGGCPESTNRPWIRLSVCCNQQHYHVHVIMNIQTSVELDGWADSSQVIESIWLNNHCHFQLKITLANSQHNLVLFSFKEKKGRRILHNFQQNLCWDICLFCIRRVS